MRFLSLSQPFVRAAFLGLLVLSLAMPAWASDFGGVGGQPAHPRADDDRTKQWLVYTLNPGESVDDEILVKNTTNHEVNVKLYPADYVQSTDGGFALEQEVEARNEVGDWVELSETEFTLPASSQTTIPFKLTVPDDPRLDVGDHMGGIIIQEVKPDDTTSGGIQLSVRTGVRIYVTIPGTIQEDVRLNKVDVQLDREARKGTISTSIKNAGNTGKELTIKTHVEHSYPFLNKLFPRLPKDNERVFQVLRDDELTSHFEFDLPWFSYAKVDVSVDYKGQDGTLKTMTQDPIFRFILPPQIWLVSTLVGLGAFVLFLGLYIRSRLSLRRSKKRKSKR